MKTKIRTTFIRIFVFIQIRSVKEMRKVTFLLVSVVLLSVQPAAAQSKKGSTEKLMLPLISTFTVKRLTDTGTVNFHISYPDKPLLLFIYLSPDCPLSKNYTLTLNKLFQQYGGQVEFYGCIGSSSYKEEEIKSFISTYKMLFPFVIDENKKLTRYVAATVTPEVILVNKEGKRIYTGAIDDWAQGWGQQKLIVSKHYLQDAIDASLSNKEIPVKKTTAYGCLINDY